MWVNAQWAENGSPTRGTLSQVNREALLTKDITATPFLRLFMQTMMNPEVQKRGGQAVASRRRAILSELVAGSGPI